MKSKEKLYLVKFGGSLITNKKKPYTVKRHILDRLVREIKLLREEGYKIILGHGGGSFPHTSASKYRTKEGFIREDSKYGMAVVHYDAERLNMIIMKKLLDSGVEAYPLQASSIAISSGGIIKEMYMETIRHLLKHNIMPVLYGDVGMDTQLGCTILSTEEIFRYLAVELSKEFSVKIIMCEAIDGVYTKDPNLFSDAKLIPLIDHTNINEVLNYVSGAYGVDVTGGMKHKIEILYKLAEMGIESIIINCKIRGRLIKAVEGRRVKGTIIKT